MAIKKKTTEKDATPQEVKTEVVSASKAASEKKRYNAYLIGSKADE